MNDREQMHKVHDMADVVVIGGGVSGLSSALSLAEAGAGRVLVLERAAIGSGGTGKSSGVVRCHYGIRSLAAMAWRSLPVLREWNETLGEDTGFHETGYLVGVGGANVGSLLANVAMHRSIGVEVEIIDTQAASELWPMARFDDFAAFAFEPRGGFGDGHQTALAFASAARRRGVKIRQQSAVTSLDVVNGRVRGVHLGNGEYVSTGQVVVAAGSWSSALLGDVGIDLPIRAQRAAILLVDPGDQLGNVPVLSDLVSLQYIRMEGRSKLLVGDSDHSEPDWADPDDYTNFSVGDELERSATKFYHRFPGLDGAQLTSSYAGCYDVTPDYNPVISASPISGLWICAGFSGHGYKISPAVGELVADLMLGNKSRDPNIDANDFRLERFHEDQFLVGPHPYVGAGQMR